MTEEQRRKRRKKLLANLPKAIAKRDSAEGDMRRAFNRWDNQRRIVKRIYAGLDLLDKEDLENGTPSHTYTKE